MRKFLLLLIVLMVLSGCRYITTTVIEQERVDQEISGNRGYIYGTPPPQYEDTSAKTRKYYHIEVEVPLPERKKDAK